jgi:hypothetical protein
MVRAFRSDVEIGKVTLAGYQHPLPYHAVTHRAIAHVNLTHSIRGRRHVKFPDPRGKFVIFNGAATIGVHELEKHIEGHGRRRHVFGRFESLRVPKDYGGGHGRMMFATLVVIGANGTKSQRQDSSGGCELTDHLNSPRENGLARGNSSRYSMNA